MPVVGNRKETNNKGYMKDPLYKYCKQYLETGEKYYATDFTIPLSPFVYLTPLIVKSLDASIPK